MIGYFIPNMLGTGDELIEAAARSFDSQGLRLAGAVQINTAAKNSKRSKMVLSILGSGEKVGISQNLGPHATGCALDAEGLENAAQLVLKSLDSERDLLILNKFGKQERDGQGFRDVLVKALDLDVPVLLGVNPTLETAFQVFAGDFAIKVAPGLAEITTWYQKISAD